MGISMDTYKTFFQLEFTKTAIKQYQVLLIVYNPVDEVIVQWIN
ncbi:element excision factor XisH family protein [Nostoc sp.]